MTQFSVIIVHKPDVPLYIGKWTDLVQSYSPGENFDSPQDNTTFYAGKSGNPNDLGKYGQPAKRGVCRFSLNYSPGENFDSPQDNTTFYSGSAAGDLVLRISQSGGFRDSAWITVLVKTSTVSRTIPVSIVES
jgi:hypothetical protein